MTTTKIQNPSFFNEENIAIFPEEDSMKGIFAYLRYLDGKYLSRYTIEANLGYGEPSDIVMFYDTDQKYIHTEPGTYDINITFNTLFYPTHYSIANAEPTEYSTHSYTKDWDLIGIDDRKEHILDKQRDIKFCENITCNKSIPKTMKIKKPRPFTKFSIRAKEGSNSFSEENNYFILKSIDFFGVLCSSKSQCNIMNPVCITCDSHAFLINKYCIFYCYIFISIH